MPEEEDYSAFDATMALLDEAVDATPHEELLDEDRTAADDFYATLQETIREHQQSQLRAAREDRERHLKLLASPSNIPSGEQQQRELYRQVTTAHPELTLAARNESEQPSLDDIRSALEKFEALGLLETPNDS